MVSAFHKGPRCPECPKLSEVGFHVFRCELHGVTFSVSSCCVLCDTLTLGDTAVSLPVNPERSGLVFRVCGASWIEAGPATQAKVNKGL